MLKMKKSLRARVIQIHRAQMSQKKSLCLISTNAIEWSEPAEEEIPRRINTGARVERIQMDFQDNCYRAERESFTLLQTE